MSELKDSAIKLFGKTIQLLHVDDDDVVLGKADDQQQQQQQQCSSSEDIKKNTTITQTEDTSCSNSSTSSGGINDDPRTPTADNEPSSKNSTKKENQNSEEKPQKPDKILPCPRCNSMDTKFCYYNNYNVNQPRHFCKNCQRYWTAGGTMRNTPVGSGRRKNKSSSSASYYRHLIVSEAAFQPSWKTNGSVLSFGSNVPLCESMNSALNFSDKSQKSEDDLSSNSVQRNFQKYPCPIQCFPHPPPPPPPWPYPCNIQEFPRIPLPNPTHYRPPTANLSGFPVSFYPTPPYWGCTVQPPPWSIPWVTPPNDQIAPHSLLGKHSRDGYMLSQSITSSNSRNEEFSRERDSESGVFTPKTLRVSDPNEAAKSSLWSTLGILKGENGSNNDNNNNNNGGNLYKAFQSKSHEKNEVVTSSLVNLQANPAAFSRSLNFRETS
ncbi:cyclic dof factor 1 [Lactuca sativa]|uniref:Dof-type domain-containing protein n=1 Tax=Lactuca sativa TaxID=4236 RepID=A0A9R1USQ1_LACSA|nr:cyclic dof factor 1 [Lactuca sativa]KAJ0193282.1 hypothetical protein LSAT_V11C800409350 [Lactuca sativa]